MLRHEDDLLDLAGAIHLAAADPDPAAWPGALERLCDGMGGGQTMLVDHRLPGTIADCAEARCSPDWKALVFERFNKPATNPLLSAMPRLPVGVPVTLHQMLDMAPARSRVAYDEFVKVCDGYDHVGVVLDREVDRSISMGFGRTRAEGGFTATDCGLLRRLLPHLTGAALVRRRLAAALAEAEAPPSPRSTAAWSYSTQPAARSGRTRRPSGCWRGATA
ncbi:MAG TPA: hypothetical protein VFY87_07695 [Geminicoccaceae bacterium]|nr:hypothetical protein [Geminicoccaceae bacterium]